MILRRRNQTTPNSARSRRMRWVVVTAALVVVVVLQRYWSEPTIQRTQDGIFNYLGMFENGADNWGTPLSIKSLQPNERICIYNLRPYRHGWARCFEITQDSNTRFTAFEAEFHRQGNTGVQTQAGQLIGTCVLPETDRNGLERLLVLLRERERIRSARWEIILIEHYRDGRLIGHEKFVSTLYERLDVEALHEKPLPADEFAERCEQIGKEAGIAPSIIRELCTTDLLEWRIRRDAANNGM